MEEMSSLPPQLEGNQQPSRLQARERMQRREIPELPQAQRMSSVPAWLLSLLVHVGLISLLGLLWGAKSKGTGAGADRPVGVAMVYETNGDEEYFLSDGSAAGANSAASASALETTAAALAQSLPAADTLDAATAELLAGLLPETGSSAGSTAGSLSQAAGDLGLGAGGTTVGGGRQASKVKTTLFGIEGEGTRFLYVFDRSESMLGHGGAPLRRAKAELIESLQSLGPAQQFQIVFYNDSPHPLGGLSGGAPKLFTGDERSKEVAMRFVRDISADGGTQHIDALRMGLNMGPDVLFFLTDADSSPSMRDLESLQDRASRSGTTVHSIQFGSGPSRNDGGWIRTLSEATGGKYRYIDISQIDNAQP